MEHDFIREGVTAMGAGSSTLTGWSLAILGATVVGIVSSKYLRPPGKARYFYLLFIPGWISLGVSIARGDLVTQRLIAFAFAPDAVARRDIAILMNANFDAQRFALQLALFVFAAWLVTLLIWWVFTPPPPPQPEPSK